MHIINVTDEPGDRCRCTARTPFGKTEMVIDVSADAVRNWLAEKPRPRHAQAAFPSLDADGREFLISGFTPEMYASTFPDSQENEDDNDGTDPDESHPGRVARRPTAPEPSLHHHAQRIPQ